MNRLIDADALKANLFDYAPPEMTWDRGDIEHKINEMPTIVAIPVEWIFEQMQILHELHNKNEYVLQWLIETWQKEQEAHGT